MTTHDAIIQQAEPARSIGARFWGCSKSRATVAGAAGGIAMNLAMFVTFRLIGFGVHADGILLDPKTQSHKLIAVWTQLEPLPLVVACPAPIVVGLVLLAIAHGFVYRWLAASWPSGVLPRGLRFTGLVTLLSFGFWEFFTPFNLFGEPPTLIAVELCFWLVVAAAEGFTIATVFEWHPPVFRPAAYQGETPTHSSSPIVR